MSSLEAFREEVRSFIEAECPPSMRTPVVDPSELVVGGTKVPPVSDDARRWLVAMADRGWTAPTWPTECGGAGLDAEHAAVLADELRRHGCRPPLSSVHGLGMIGPVLLQFGDATQQRRFLPPTARGEIRWCQGFSEPAAGSDLAGATTRARRDGDDYVVTGQKLWTSFADECDWIFLLVRTDPEAPKRDGLSFLLVDLESPGVTVRPLTLLSGRSEFCEVFLDEVVVPHENRVGAEGDGWTITRLVLTHERRLVGAGGPGMTTQYAGAPDFVRLARTAAGVDEGAPLDDPLLRDEIARLEIDQECCRALLRAGDAHPSVVKLAFSELMKAQGDLANRIDGIAGLGWDGDAYDDGALARTRSWLFSRAWTIAGGTSEIQRNIVARQVLGLPHLGPEVES